jgi:hypothetical protein
VEIDEDDEEGEIKERKNVQELEKELIQLSSISCEKENEYEGLN